MEIKNENKKEKAIAYHNHGYNCAQAVVCTFAEELGMDEKELFRVTEALGFGMGTMGTCGAVSAMAIVVSLVESDGNLEKPETKRNSYRAMKNLSNKFDKKNNSLICREIKGVDTGKVLRSCDGCVEDAVEIVQEYLKNK